MNDWLKVEFHCHTIFSKDSLNKIPDLLDTAERKGVDRIVITDHNNIQGAMEAKKMAPERIIVGEEILTSSGELLASFVTEEVPPRLPPLEAIARLRAQGAFISVSHPFDLRRRGWPLADLLEIAPLVDAIEVFNARSIRKEVNEQAQLFAQERDIPGTVGSDAHALYELGTATLCLPPFATADELRAVIREGRPEARLSSPFVIFSSSYARFYKRFHAARS